MHLVVKLTDTPAPVLTITPDDDGVAPDDNGITLVWVRDATGAEFQFSANSLSGLPPDRFSPPQYHPETNTVTVEDHYTKSAPGGTYPYALSVTSGTTTYHASGNPEIINR